MLNLCEVVVICVTDSEVRNLIEQGGRIVTDDQHEWEAKALERYFQRNKMQGGIFRQIQEF